MNLPEGTSTGRTSVEDERRYVLHASAPVYYPAPDGATYCNSATCVHDHPDTEKGRQMVEECAARLARVIASGRLPSWAILANPLP